MSFEQIEKFQCLSLSTPQGLSHGTFRTHVARDTCPETCLKVFQLSTLSLLKTYVTSLGEFSKLIEACGEVCGSIQRDFIKHLKSMHRAFLAPTGALDVGILDLRPCVSVLY